MVMIVYHLLRRLHASLVQDVETEEEKNALPGYDEDNWFSKYYYLQSLRIPLTFDQLTESIEYVEGNKSHIVVNGGGPILGVTAISNNVMMAGKHYASFEVSNGTGMFIGVMRPGEAMQSAGGGPLWPEFYENFTQRRESKQYNNNVNCCVYDTFNGWFLSSDWGGGFGKIDQQDGPLEELSDCFEVGMLLNLDEETLSVYNNGIKRGLAGHYCWVVATAVGSQVTIKRGIVPAS